MGAIEVTKIGLFRQKLGHLDHFEKKCQNTPKKCSFQSNRKKKITNILKKHNRTLSIKSTMI
jgi:hypothetical protein